MTIDTTQQTLAEYSYKTLKDAIINGTYLPGEKLRIETLKAHLKIGPTPIREALSRLVSTGLIEMESNRGFYVRKVSEDEVKDIYDTFLKIELLALTEAMKKGDAAWEANILATLHKLSAVEKSSASIDTTLWLQLNYEFHCALITGCNSPSLLNIREGIYQLFDRYCHLSLLNNEESLRLNHEQHEEIAKAVITRNEAKACQLITKHLEYSLKQVLKKLAKNK